MHSSYGYHIIRLVEKQPGGFRPVADVRADIENTLRRARAGQQTTELLQQALESGTVELHLESARAKGAL